MVKIIRYILSLATLFLAGAHSLIGQEVELRDSLEAARVTDLHRMRREVGVMLTTPENLRATASPLGEGDALRWVQALPGVATGADGTSAFYVRGGNSGGNLLTVDGIPVYGYSHLLGITSILPSDVVATARFVKGGFGGAQGNFSSSHIALQTVDSRPEQREITLTLNNFLAGAGVTAPVGEKGAVIAAGRISPLSIEYQALKGLMQGGLGDLNGLGAGVFDLFGKFCWAFNEKDRISASVLGSMDRYTFLTSDGSGERMGWGNIIGAVQSRHERGWGSVRLSASYNGYRSIQQQDKNFRSREYNFSLTSLLDEISLSADGAFPLGNGIEVDAGIKMRLGGFAPGQFGQKVNRKWTALTSGYVQGVWRTRRMSVDGGVRLNAFKYDQTGLVPDFNLSAKWRPFPFLAVEGTFDRISQFYHTLEGLPLGWTMDVIVPASSSLPAEELRQGYAGLEFSFGRNQLSVGAFVRKMDNVIYYKNAGDLFSRAQTAWEEAAEVGKGDARGIEVLYEFCGEEFYAKASATVANATRSGFATVNGGRPFHAAFDRHVVANATVEWRQISLSFVYQDGNWVNGRGERYEVPFPGDESVMLEYYSSINNHQMPPLVRLDASYRLKWSWGRVANEVNLGVCNLLNHFNPYTVYYDTKEGVWKEMALLPILPNFSWRIKF